MKKFLSFLFLCMALNGQAQDIIITKEGESMKVWKVEIAAETVFYQTSEEPNSPIARMAKSDILMIKYQDGRKLIMGEENNGANQPTTSAQPTSADVQNVSDAEANAQVVKRLQTPVQYAANPTTSKANLVLATYVPLDDAVMVDKNLEVSVEANSNWMRKDKEYIGVSGYWTMKLYVKNRSTKTMYLDLGNSFVIRGTESVAYYVPTVTSSTQGNTRGGSVNLGAVAGALGVGGGIGALANGLNVGGTNTNYSTTTVMAQRIVAIPPTSTKEMGEVRLMNLIGKDNPFPNAPLDVNRMKGAAYMLFPQEMTVGEVREYNPADEVMRFGFIITYAEDENQTMPQTLHATYGLDRVIGLPQKASAMYNWLDSSELDITLSPNFRDVPYLLLRQKGM